MVIEIYEVENEVEIFILHFIFLKINGVMDVMLYENRNRRV